MFYGTQESFRRRFSQRMQKGGEREPSNLICVVEKIVHKSGNTSFDVESLQRWQNGASNCQFDQRVTEGVNQDVRLRPHFAVNLSSVALFFRQVQHWIWRGKHIVSDLEEPVQFVASDTFTKEVEKFDRSFGFPHCTNLKNRRVVHLCKISELSLDILIRAACQPAHNCPVFGIIAFPRSQKANGS
ncbi:hypothetical protein RY27_09305 [Litorilinea aerophila]|nr:hypothetical protein RY27_09305 [Litorilinea aerophila]